VPPSSRWTCTGSSPVWPCAWTDPAPTPSRRPEAPVWLRPSSWSWRTSGASRTRPSATRSSWRPGRGGDVPPRRHRVVLRHRAHGWGA
jgi:hypothetical protein